MWGGVFAGVWVSVGLCSSSHAERAAINTPIQVGVTWGTRVCISQVRVLARMWVSVQLRWHRHACVY